MKEYWEHIYKSKQPTEVSWTEELPALSIKLIDGVFPDKSKAIIDVGGGNSHLVDYLLKENFKNVSLLDIAGAAIARAKKSLGKESEKVHWIENDILDFEPRENYAIWHDRAAFHFLTTTEEVQKYVFIANNCIEDKGYLIVGTFATNGPLKCSGLAIKQYSEELLKETFAPYFNLLHCEGYSHTTPFNTQQSFIFGVFQKA